MENEKVLKNNVDLKDEERQKCEIWTRVMGYFRPVSEFNKGKKSEHNERVHFEESECKCCHQKLD